MTGTAPALAAAGGAGAVAAVLAYAAAGHAAHLDAFAAVVGDHGVVGRARARPVALAVTAAEAALAVAVPVEALARPGEPAASSVAAALLFLAFAAYLGVAGRRVGEAGLDCGCGALGDTVTPVAWRRPAALAAGVIAVTVAVALGPGGGAGPGLAARLLAVTAAWAVATGLLSFAEAGRVSAASMAEARAAYRLQTAAPARGTGGP